MDRNTIIGLLLIGLILLMFSYLNQPKKPTEAEKQKTEQKKQAKEEKEQPKQEKSEEEQIASALQLDSLTDTSNQVAGYPFKGNDSLYTLENDLLKLKISAKGGKVVFVELKKYKKANGENVVLMNGDNNAFGYSLQYQGKTVNTSNLYFNESEASNDSKQTITLTLNLGENQFLQNQYTIHEKSYMVDYDVNFSGFDKLVPANQNEIPLHWDMVALQQEKHLKNEKKSTTIYYKPTDDKADDLSSSSSDKEDINKNVSWVSFKQQFFNQTLIGDKVFSEAKLETVHDENSDYVKILKADLAVPFKHSSQESYAMRYYFGPNHFGTLKKFDLGMEKMIPLGWGIFGWVNRFFIIPVFNFLNKFIGNYGIIILILTVMVKVIVTPLTYKSYLSQAKMRAIKPELDKLKEKFGDNMQKMQMEQMAMYRKTGINPLGGCIPMLLQMPILIAMFRFFPSSIELRQKSFLWAHDLSTYDSILHLPFKIPFYGDHVSLFTILMAISTLLYSLQNQRLTPSTNDQMSQQMRMMSYIMPLFMLFFFNNYSSGLSCYYFFYNALSFGQMFLFKNLINEEEIRNKIEERKKKPLSKKRSRFQRQMEEMMKKQQQAKKGK